MPIDHSPTNTGANRACKIKIVEAGADELQLDLDLPWESSLDNLGEEDCDNPYINWINIDDPHTNAQAASVAFMLDENDMDKESDEEDEDTINWKLHVPPWLHNYGTIFSKKKSERMPEWKVYDHPINFVDNAVLPKPAKVYPLSLKERNSLDEWIDEEL